MVHAPSYRSDGRATVASAAIPVLDDLPAARNGSLEGGHDTGGEPTPVPSNDKLLIGSNIQINGSINDDVFQSFMTQLGQVRASDEDLILELMTTGGDADTARRIALELRIFQGSSGKRAYCVGKTIVYSAGITILSAFPRPARFLTVDTTLLIHERHVERTITLQGPIKSSKQIIQEELAALDTADRVQREDFEHFVEGSSMSCDDLFERAQDNCYLTAQEALRLELIGRILEPCQSSVGKQQPARF